MEAVFPDLYPAEETSNFEPPLTLTVLFTTFVTLAYPRIAPVETLPPLFSVEEFYPFTPMKAHPYLFPSLRISLEPILPKKSFASLLKYLVHSSLQATKNTVPAGP